MSKAQPDSCHTIRLHGPWHVEPLALTKSEPAGPPVDLQGDLPAAKSVKLPAAWEDLFGANFRGRLLCKRRFGRPTNLDAQQRVDLVIQTIAGLTNIALNGDSLGGSATGESAHRFDVTPLLLPRNELQFEVDLPAGGDAVAIGGTIGDARLEIYESEP